MPWQEARAMEDWPSYENFTVPNNVVMDQITLNAVLASSRIGIEVAISSLFTQSWEDAEEVWQRRLILIIHKFAGIT